MKTFTIKPAATAENIEAVKQALDDVPYTENVVLRQVGDGYEIDFDSHTSDTLMAVRRVVQAITDQSKGE